MSETLVEAVPTPDVEDVAGAAELALLGGTEDDDGSGAADEVGTTAVDVGAVDGDGAGVLEATRVA